MEKLEPARESPPARPPAVGPLDQETLEARGETKRMRKRARQLTKPAYIYTDAAFRSEITGLAYTSRALGERVAVKAAKNSSEAEFWAMVMAMYDADRALGSWPAVVFRTDCQSVALFRIAKGRLLAPPRAHMATLFGRHPLWSLELVNEGGTSARTISHVRPSVKVALETTRNSRRC